MSDFVTIPLNKLKLSPANMRQGDTRDPITGVGAVYISDLLGEFRGRRQDDMVLQNLRVTEERKGKKATGFFLVHVGGRRWRTLAYMAAQGEIPGDLGVPCKVCPDEALALTESVAENQARLPPEPAQVFRAFKGLIDEGKTPAEIAERFDITEQLVKRRLRLGNVSPKLFELFERNEINLEQMYALCLSEDHAVQEAAWFDGVASGWTQANHIKQRITKEETATGNCATFKFVGEEAYLAGGGSIRHDLFSSQEGAGYINNVGLADTLALEKLQEVADTYKADGWSWVEARLSFDWRDREKFERIHADPAPLSEADEAELERLEGEYSELELADDTSGLADLERQIEALQAKQQPAFTDAQKAVSGVVVTITNNGALDVQAGWVRPEDKKALKAQERAEGGSSGGGSIGSAKRDDGLSAAQVANLTAHRTLALQAHMMSRPDVAFVALVHRMLLVAFYKDRNRSYWSTATPDSALVLSGRSREHNILKHGDAENDLHTCPAMLEIERRKDEVRRQLPVQDGLWTYLNEQPQERLMELLAVATADQLYVVQTLSSLGYRGTSADDIARASGFEMADFWSPDEAFFAKQKKDQILAAIREVGAEVTPAMEKMKRSELASVAADAVDGKRWVPPIIRTPEAVPLTAEQMAPFLSEEGPDDERADEFDDEFDDGLSDDEMDEAA